MLWEVALIKDLYRRLSSSIFRGSLEHKHSVH